MSLRENNDDWEACPPGTLANLVNKKKFEQRRQFLQRSFIAGGTVAVAAVSLGVLASSREWLRDESPIALSCAQVVSYLPAYLEGKLDKETCEGMERHLRECPHCEERRKKEESKMKLKSKS